MSWYQRDGDREADELLTRRRAGAGRAGSSTPRTGERERASSRKHTAVGADVAKRLELQPPEAPAPPGCEEGRDGPCAEAGNSHAYEEEIATYSVATQLTLDRLHTARVLPPALGVPPMPAPPVRVAADDAAVLRLMRDELRVVEIEAATAAREAADLNDLHRVACAQRDEVQARAKLAAVAAAEQSRVEAAAARGEVQAAEAAAATAKEAARVEVATAQAAEAAARAAAKEAEEAAKEEVAAAKAAVAAAMAAAAEAKAAAAAAAMEAKEVEQAVASASADGVRAERRNAELRRAQSAASSRASGLEEALSASAAREEVAQRELGAARQETRAVRALLASQKTAWERRAEIQMSAVGAAVHARTQRLRVADALMRWRGAARLAAARRRDARRAELIARSSIDHAEAQAARDVDAARAEKAEARDEAAAAASRADAARAEADAARAEVSALRCGLATLRLDVAETDMARGAAESAIVPATSDAATSTTELSPRISPPDSPGNSPRNSPSAVLAAPARARGRGARAARGYGEHGCAGCVRANPALWVTALVALAAWQALRVERVSDTWTAHAGGVRDGRAHAARGSGGPREVFGHRRDGERGRGRGFGAGSVVGSDGAPAADSDIAESAVVSVVHRLLLTPRSALGAAASASITPLILRGSGAATWLIAGLWLRVVGWHYPFAGGWLVALGVQEVLEMVTGAITG